jgi:hypothetical protein
MKKTSTKSTKKDKIVPTIFVQIASYRDPELRNTIQDALANATHPDRLQFGIAWQHSPYDEWDTLDEYLTNPQFTVIDIDYRDAKGVCYARHLLNQRYGAQTYTLQLDSHHRFTKGWDDTLIQMLEALRSKNHPKPILTSYLPSFNPANDPASRLQTPWVMEFDRFSPDGNVHFLPHTIDNFQTLTKPIHSRFASGHFLFADGIFCTEVPYDPTYYFHGEEINLSVRAYLEGYDLFAPHRVIIWHEYTRNGKTKHWDDHRDWSALERESHRHNRERLGVDGVRTDKTLVGSVRQLEDYEHYAGISFTTRKVHKNTIAKQLPPISTSQADHDSGLLAYQRVCIDVYKKSLPYRDYTFWAVALEDNDGNEIHREDVDERTAQALLTEPYEKDKFVHLWRSFYHDQRPHRWIVWPHSKEHGWGERLTGVFDAK